MKKKLKQLLALVLTLAVVMGFALPAAAADPAADANLALARQNLATEEGAAFDREMGMAMMAIPAATEAVAACQRAHPGHHELQGYFHFTSATDYRLVLAPQSPFADCLARALQGRAVPAPPSLPWFNHFTFRTQGPAP